MLFYFIRRSYKIVRHFLKPWQVEVTFEEVRAHLGVETDISILRTTPVLMALQPFLMPPPLSDSRFGSIKFLYTLRFHPIVKKYNNVLPLSFYGG
ncbi:MAG TPA: hypothetical protein ENJ45_05825 [Phaeodactylibacter sp.]|nr:hypothetical protein [Phaeodactylibacter sp.]